MNSLSKNIASGLIIMGMCLTSSCSTAPVRSVTLPVTGPEFRSNTTHIVGPGETLWRISKIYNVPMSSIVGANSLKASDMLKMGQKLVIPNATSPKPVINLYPSSKWRYIIIHHSATDSGNALSVHKAHIHRGWDRGAGYHFIIDRGTNDKDDGQIEMTPRWIKQEDGAHCKASNMNEKAIGICLIGDFTEHIPTKKQMSSLIDLVNKLRNYYRIPVRNIIAHGHVVGAATQCPGRKFPWSEFQGKLKQNKERDSLFTHR